MLFEPARRWGASPLGWVTKPYGFIGFGATDVTKPYGFIGFGATDVTRPYEFIWYSRDWEHLRPGLARVPRLRVRVPVVGTFSYALGGTFEMRSEHKGHIVPVRIPTKS